MWKSTLCIRSPNFNKSGSQINNEYSIMGVALISASLNLVKREADLLKRWAWFRDTVKWILMYLIKQAVLTHGVLTQTAPHSYWVVNVCPALAVSIRERTKLLKSRHVYNFSLVFWRPPSPKHVWGILKNRRSKGPVPLALRFQHPEMSLWGCTLI